METEGGEEGGKRSDEGGKKEEEWYETIICRHFPQVILLLTLTWKRSCPMHSDTSRL